MLTCKDVVLVKDKKGTVTAFQEYNRVYFQYGPDDPVKEVEVTSKGKVVTRPDGTKITKQKPSEKVTKHDVDTLFADAVAHIQAENPKDNPIYLLLSDYSYGADLGVKSKIGADLRPKPEVAIDKQVEKMAAILMAVRKDLTKDLAIAAAKVALGM